MYLLSTLAFLLTALASGIIILASIISKKSFLDREKTSPFECGYDPFSSSRIPFSLRFYMITIIFLIFDVEIAIILPFPLISTELNAFTWILIFFIFIITLLMGLIHEWNYGSLDWTL